MQSHVTRTFLAVTTRIAQLVHVDEAGLAQALVRLGRIDAQRVLVARVQRRVGAFVDHLLTDDATEAVRIRRKVDVSGLAATYIRFRCIRAYSVRRAVVRI